MEWFRKRRVSRQKWLLSTFRLQDRCPVELGNKLAMDPHRCERSGMVKMRSLSASMGGVGVLDRAVTSIWKRDQVPARVEIPLAVSLTDPH